MSEEISDGYYIRRREFLNEDLDLPAYIIALVEDTRAIKNDDPARSWNNGEITLDLADCNRRVSFYFDMRDQRERANSLRKISLIAEIVNAVRDAIASEAASRNARPVEVTAAPTESSPDTGAPEVADEKPVYIEDSREQVFTSHFITLGL